MSPAQREQLVAQHKEEQTAYADYLGLQEAGKELLLYGVGDDALAPLKKQYINLGNSTIHSMILHLREKTAIKMTTLQKFKYKAEGYGKQWDPTTSITAYFTALDKFQTSLADRGISTSIDEMTMAAGARMWESEMFTEDQMVAWENKTAAQQTWQALQDYFTEKWLERRQYSQATAKHSRFKDAALAAQETAAAEEEGEALAMMFALLQEQHRAQLDAMASANQKAMDVMFERMNAIVAGNGPGPDKENTPPGGNVNPGADNDTGTMKRKKKKCPHCGKTVFHKAAECYELEANASKWWAGWKSVKDTGEATKWQGPGTSNNISLVADKLENTPAITNINYWSPLACLVEEQEDNEDDHLLSMRTEIGHLNVDHFLSISTDISKPTVKNKIAEKWKRKIANRTGILDTGCTSGAGAEMDMELFHDTGLPSKKVFMLPDKTKIPATKMMRLKHNL